MRQQKHTHHRFFVVFVQIAPVCASAASVSAFEINHVLERLGQPTLDELCAEMTNGLHSGQPTDTFCLVLADAGQRLGAVLPRAEDDANELADALVTLD